MLEELGEGAFGKAFKARRRLVRFGNYPKMLPCGCPAQFTPPRASKIASDAWALRLDPPTACKWSVWPGAEARTRCRGEAGAAEGGAQDGMAVVVKQMVRTMLTEKDKLEVLFPPLKPTCSFSARLALHGLWGSGKLHGMLRRIHSVNVLHIYL